MRYSLNCHLNVGLITLFVLYGEFMSPYVHLGNDTGHRTATMMAPLLHTSGPVRYEAVLHSCGTSPVGGMGTDL